MLRLTIQDQKAFTKELFAGGLFDRFLCCKAVLRHNVDYTIDGHCNLEFYDSDQRAERQAQTYASWSEIRPFVFQILKGQRLPLRFHIVLCASPDSTRQLLRQSGCALSPESVEGLYVNLYYRDGILYLTTGSSYRIFTSDVSLDRCFEEAVIKLVRAHHIAFVQ